MSKPINFSEDEVRCRNLSPDNYYECEKQPHGAMTYATGPDAYKVKHWHKAVRSDGKEIFWKTDWVEGSYP